MKKWVVSVIILCFSLHLQAQEKIAFKKSNDSLLVKILANIRSYKQFGGSEMSAALCLVGNNYNGTKNPEGTDEVSDDLYVAVSEYDEYPRQSVFVLKNIFAVKNLFITQDNEKNLILEFSYFDRQQKLRKTSRFMISPDRLTPIVKR